jgi:hypothetical protein
VMGLSEDVKILTHDFEEYITNIVDDMHKKYHKN